MDFIFDIRKAIAAAGYVCKLNQGSFDMLKLIKAIYLAERKALVEWHRPITGDKFWSLENGPVVSRIYDLIQERVGGPEMESWRAVFNPRRGDIVSLKGDFNEKPLSRREKEALRMAYNQIKDLTTWEVIQLVHKLPEWENPGKSSKPIDPSVIFYHENLGESAVQEIEREIEAFQSAKASLQAS
jgi:uncharacterized phage-associated protein